MEVTDKIIVGIASVKRRRMTLRNTIESLKKQSFKPNVIYVYLNDYTEAEVPNFLKRSGIQVFTGDKNGDRGDAGKFFKVGEEKCYYFSCDDDLIYPESYIAYMIGGIEGHNRKNIVSLHGSIFKDEINNFYTDRTLVNFKRELRHSTPVHISGTGVTAFHTDTIKVSKDDFKIPNMADIWLGIAAQKQKIGIVVLPHKARWVGVQPRTAEDSIFHTNIRDNTKIKLNTDTVNSIQNWVIN